MWCLGFQITVWFLFMPSKLLKLWILSPKKVHLVGPRRREFSVQSETIRHWHLSVPNSLLDTHHSQPTTSFPHLLTLCWWFSTVNGPWPSTPSPLSWLIPWGTFISQWFIHGTNSCTIGGWWAAGIAGAWREGVWQADGRYLVGVGEGGRDCRGIRGNGVLGRWQGLCVCGVCVTGIAAALEGHAAKGANSRYSSQVCNYFLHTENGISVRFYVA